MFAITPAAHKSRRGFFKNPTNRDHPVAGRAHGYRDLSRLLSEPRCSIHKIVPSNAHPPVAANSKGPKLPGTNGRTFIKIKSADTRAPIEPTNFAFPERILAAPLKNARQDTNHPVADASDPTSEIHTSTDGPRNEAATVKQPTKATEKFGVRNRS